MEIKRKIGESKTFKRPAEPHGIIVTVVNTKGGTVYSRTLKLEPTAGILSGVILRPETMEEIVRWSKGEDK